MTRSRSASPARLFTGCLAALALALLAAVTPAQAETKTLTDFSPNAVKQAWMSVNDSVMGGVSKGGFKASGDNTLVFSGTLSLENRGGFASIRTKSQDLDLDEFDTLVVRVKGDGRTYYMDLRTPTRRMASSYRTAIKTEKNKWIEVSVPLSEFYYTSFGRKIDRAPIKAKDINGFGFTLADKKAGPFKLEIASVNATTQSVLVNAKLNEGSTFTLPPSAKSAPTDKAIASSQADSRVKNIFDTANSAGQFKILLAAAEAAGLLDALKNPDADLTVFAPSDAAFAALPKGTVQSLLRPENKDKLVAILTYHILPNRLELNPTVKTLQGQSLVIQNAGKIKVGQATVTAANIQTSNGVIHVIDSVLIPELPKPSPKQKAMRVIELAIDRGVPIFNAGQIEACAAIYEVAVTSLVNGHADVLSANDMKLLQKTIASLGDHSARDQAWALREAMDKVYTSLESNN